MENHTIDKAKIAVRSIIWFILFFSFLLSAMVLVQWSWLLLAMVVFASAVLALPVFLVLYLIRKRRYSGMPSALYLKTTLMTIFIVPSLIAFPVYYLAWQVEADPVVLPDVTLTNGDKTVVFQGMIHVASGNFYKSVVYDIENALNQGYRLYFEEVRPSPGAGDRWLAEKVGGGNNISDNYKKVATLCGLHFQLDYFGFIKDDMKKNPERYLQADVTSLDMKREYDRLIKADPAFAQRMAALEKENGSATGDNEGKMIARIVTWLNKGTEDQKKIAGIIGRGILAASLSAREDNPLNPVILDFRNRYLVSKIENEPDTKIYLIYGAAHLPGVVAMLRRHDPDWKVVSVKWLRAIAAPEKFEKSLTL